MAPVCGGFTHVVLAVCRLGGIALLCCHLLQVPVVTGDGRRRGLRGGTGGCFGAEVDEVPNGHIWGGLHGSAGGEVFWWVLVRPSLTAPSGTREEGMAMAGGAVRWGTGCHGASERQGKDRVTSVPAWCPSAVAQGGHTGLLPIKCIKATQSWHAFSVLQEGFSSLSPDELRVPHLGSAISQPDG